MTIIKLMFILLFRYDLLLRYLDDELMQDFQLLWNAMARQN